MGFAPWGETSERWRRESGFSGPAREFGAWREQSLGLEPDSQPVPAEYGPFPHFEPRKLSEDAEFIVSTDWRGITMRNRRGGGSMPEWIDHPIKNPDDWQRYKDERLQPRLDERLVGIDKWLAGIEGVDAPVQVGTFPWGVFGTARDLLGAEELLVGFYSEPEMVHDVMETNTTLWLALYERLATKVRIEHIHIWEDMSGRQGSLISPAMIEEFMMPQYDRIAAFAREHKVPVFSVDSDGLVDELVPVMMRHGVNAFMPFEVQAGSDIEVFRARYPKLGIFGGLDKRALAAGRTEMHRELDRAARMLAAGGWVPGFDHLIPPDVPWENYRYFMGNLGRLVSAI
jgi:uroporphyrinogen decarboxylase